MVTLVLSMYFAKLQIGAGKGGVFTNHTWTKRMTCGIFSGGVSSAIGTPLFSI